MKLDRPKTWFEKMAALEGDSEVGAGAPPTAKSGPTIKRHRSWQDYETSKEFISAVEKRFGALRWDLAARADNAKAPAYLHCSNGHDSLKVEWHGLQGNLWLNPPYNDMEPWAKKCAEEGEKGAKILLLVPASVDSNWWSDYVHKQAMVLFLHPRLSFDGKNPYPKPLALCCYRLRSPEWDWYDRWVWK